MGGVDRVGPIAGHEDERHIRRFLLRNRQRRETVERRQSMIGKNYRRFEALELLLKRRLGIHAFEREVETPGFERVLDQHRVTRFVFDHQDAQFLFDNESPN